MKASMMIVDRDSFRGDWIPRGCGTIDYAERDIKITAMLEQKKIYKQSRRDIWAHPERKAKIERHCEIMCESIGYRCTIELCEYRLEKYKARQIAG